MVIRIFYVELAKEGQRVFPCIAKIEDDLGHSKAYNFKIVIDGRSDRFKLQLEQSATVFNQAFEKREFLKDRYVERGFVLSVVQTMTFSDNHDEVIKNQYLRMDSFQHMMETRFDLTENQVHLMFKYWKINSMMESITSVCASSKLPQWGVF